jgi:hypothetical protein
MLSIFLRTMSSQPLITHVNPPKIPESLFPIGGFNVSSLMTVQRIQTPKANPITWG